MVQMVFFRMYSMSGFIATNNWICNTMLHIPLVYTLKNSFLFLITKEKLFCDISITHFVTLT